MTATQTHYDAIIVGSGPGGGSVARDLTRYGKKVLILERGDYKPTTGGFGQMLTRGWMPGSQLPLTVKGQPILRGITTGGTTNFYTATAFPPPYDILESYGIDIKQEVEDLKGELPIAPISDHLMSPASKAFMESARALGYDCEKFDKYIYQDRCLQNCDSCIIGCPNDAKWTARHLVDEALENGAEMINHANVKRVITENGRATGVEFKHDGKKQIVTGDVIVVSAGGIGTPLILRKSGFEKVGEDICADPAIVVCGQVEGLEGTGKAVPMMTGFHLKEEGIMFSDLHLPQILKTLFDVHAFNFTKMTEFSNVIPIMVKVRDELSGRVINNGIVSKKIMPVDKAKIKKGEKIAQDILKQAGATKTYSSQVIMSHPGASVKIGEHVDADLKTKYDNLYVCDCSVFPEALGFPPSLTLLGLGTRLAKHLAGRNDNSAVAPAKVAEPVI